MSSITWLVVIGIGVVLFYLFRSRAGSQAAGPMDGHDPEYAHEPQQGHGHRGHGGGGCCG